MRVLSNQIVISNILFADSLTKSVGINTQSPQYTLDVVGSMGISGNFFAGEKIICACNITVNGSPVLTTSGGGTGINLSGSNGINCNSPRFPLDMNGSANIAGDLYVGASSFSNLIRFYGTTTDGVGTNNHSVIGERVYGGTGTEKSELLIFKGDNIEDRVRLLSSGGFKVDITGYANYWSIGGSPPAATIQALTVTSEGRVGINTTAPAYTLDVYGKMQVTGLATCMDGLVAKIALDIDSYSGVPATNAPNGVHFIFYSPTGSGGGLTASNFTLYKYGPTSGGGNTVFTIDFNDANNTLVYNYDIIATGNVTAYSDIRLKENIETIDSPLEKIQKMRGVYYTLKEDSSSKRKIGVIAQEMEEVLPEVVYTGTSEDKWKSVAYGNIVAVLIEGMKAQESTLRYIESYLHG
jgi:Chaperone of endosialidase